MPAEAYVAIDYHTSGDYTPYFYRTHDYRQDVDEDRQRHAHRSAERQFRARDPSRHEEAGAAVRRHGELDVRLVRRRRRLAIAHAESAEHIVSRHRDQGQRSRVGTYGRSLWILDDFSPLRQITPAHRIGAGASVQAGRRDSRAPQRERRHAVSAGGSARAEPAARRDHLLLLGREAVARHHARRARRGGQCRAPLLERADCAAERAAASCAESLDRDAQAHAGRRRNEPHQLGHSLRQPAGVHAQLRDQRE